MAWAVVITERSGKDLTDYQVRVEVTDSQFFSECTEQRFVEFYDSDKTTLLSHYTELFDVAGKRAVFWVKVPSIPASGTKTIYLNVNTARTEDLSNGEAVFDFFDDGTNLEGWDINGNSGQDTEEGNPPPSYFAESVRGYYMSKFIGLTTNGIVTFNVKSNGLGNFFFLCNSAGEGYGYRIDTRSGNYSGFQTATSWTEWTAPSEGFTAQANTWYKFGIVIKETEATLYYEATEDKSPTLPANLLGTYSITLKGGYIGLVGDALGSRHFTWWDNIIVRKYTEPEPSVMVVKGGATATLDFKRIVAKALAGKISHILNGDPKLKLYSGGSLVKEITAGARLRKEDTANKRYIVMFLFVDDSNDAYTTDSQELIFPHSDGDYVAFTQSESFEKTADEPLPLRWEIYVPWTVDEEGWGEVWP